MDMNQYLSMFIDESKEHLQTMNDSMLALEQTPDDISIVQTMFRSAHTLKGMSATMGFEDIASLTHEMENVLDLVRNGQLAMNEHIVETMFRCLDLLESMVGDIVAGGTGSLDVQGTVAELKAILGGPPVQDKASAAAGGTGPAAGSARGLLDEYQSHVVLQSLESGFRAYRIDVTIQRECVMKSVRAYMVFEALGAFGEVIQSEPSAEDIEADRFDYSFTVVLLTSSAPGDIEAAVKNISEIEKATVAPIGEAELKAPRGAVEAAASAAPAAPEKRTSPAADAKPGAARAAAASRTIRVDIERLDKLMNLFSELLIDRVRLETLASDIRRPELTETVEHMSRVSSELQTIVMKLRMISVESVFNRFPRMVRDVSKSLGKKVDLIITGAETELDRTVVDEIGDPLVHLLRNSIDHGLESVEERIRAGKPETGKVYLRAFQSGNYVFIEVEDDGKGIDRAAVLQRAVEKGIVTREQGEAMDDGAVYQLLFAPGFSTAKVISDISGRGVGLDVVKSKIESLGGQVRVSSAPGKGSTFSIQLPLTLSILAAMLIKMGSEKYAIPLSSIVETMILDRKKIRVVHGRKLIDYRSGVIPYVSLAETLDVPDYDEAGEEETEIVIIKKGDRHAALAVDELIGQQEIVLKPMGKYLTGIFAVSGATILGDGQVALIIDTNALIK